jgi:hypothetical protein
MDNVDIDDAFGKRWFLDALPDRGELLELFCFRNG